MRTPNGPTSPIRWIIANSPLGWWGLAATDQGICWLAWGESRDEWETTLRQRFPTAVASPRDRQLKHWVALLQRYFAGCGPLPRLPLDLQGSAFQQRVWQALQNIPYGETRSYHDIAVAIGRPTAARAVARACATNPVAVLVPCHRVVGRDGQLCGYAGGLERKRQLLAWERTLPNGDNAPAATFVTADI
ncbi:MAG: methylated-DNA--[protein]-cysteine S-methyltransferase [Gemmataceae bacterium]|nr:methylated-DNA--[protein]-cysteine S-methyltransferase [Gemmataceae bacterium]